MRGEPGLFDVDERLKELSAKADDLERLNADTGYGGLLNVHHSVLGYEAAGVVAIHIGFEDVLAFERRWARPEISRKSHRAED